MGKGRRKPWYRADRGKWFTKIDGKQVDLGSDYTEACRELQRLLDGTTLENASARDFGDMAFADLAEAYLDDLYQRKSASHYEGMGFRLRRAIDFLPENLLVRNLRKADLADVDRAMRKPKANSGRPYSPTTIHDTLAAIKSAVTWARKLDMLERDPLYGFQLPPRGMGRTRYVTKTEFRSLYLACSRNPELQRILLMIRCTGARPKELRDLRWEHVHRDDETGRTALVIRSHKSSSTTRNPLPRCIPLPRPMEKLLDRIWQEDGPFELADHVFLNSRGGPFRKDSMAQAIRRARKRAGIEARDGEEVVLYSQRHAYLTEQAPHVQEFGLAALAGHTDTRMTRKYVHLSQTHLHRILEQADASRRNARGAAAAKKRNVPSFASQPAAQAEEALPDDE